MRLFDVEGRRLYPTELYLAEEERRAFVLAAAKAPCEVRTYRHTSLSGGVIPPPD
jgi:hypothetical protein